MRRILACGAGALLVECDEGADALELWNRLTIDPPPGVTEVVPGAQTVLVLGRADAATRRLLLNLEGVTVATAGTSALTIPVRYDGADLEAVASRAGLTTTEVIARHCAPTYTVAFGGFVPGFAYLSGLDPSLSLPRRDSPRSRVPAGSVAIADKFSGIYPCATPGGWHILGTTDVLLFDSQREPAALLGPGQGVRFEPLR